MQCSTALGTKYLCNSFHSVKWQFLGFCYIEEDEVFFIHLSFFFGQDNRLLRYCCLLGVMKELVKWTAIIVAVLIQNSLFSDQ